MLRDGKLWRLNAELPSSPWGRSWVGPLSLLGVTATSAEALCKTNAECYFRVLPFFFFFHKSKNLLQIYFGERKRVVMYVSLKGEVVKTKFWKEGGTYARQYVTEKNAFLPNSSLLNTDELYMRRQLKNVFLTSVSI